MIADPYSPLALKRRRLTNIDLMDAESARAKLAAAKEKFGRDIRVFETSPPSPAPNEVSSGAEVSDDFYEFTPEDYYRILATKKEDKFLKTRKLREAEEAARRSRVTKAVIRVRFPDNCTLEATFHPSETFQSLVDLLTKVIAQPEVPFYIYTTPPKKLIKDMSKDFYSAGFIPGAIVYFSYDLSKGDKGAAGNSCPFLREDVMSLKGVELVPELQAEAAQSAAPEPATVAAAPVVQERKTAERKPVKPKWLKM